MGALFLCGSVLSEACISCQFRHLALSLFPFLFLVLPLHGCAVVYSLDCGLHSFSCWANNPYREPLSRLTSAESWD